MIGIAADVVSLRLTIIALALVMLASALVFSSVVWKPSKAYLFREEEPKEKYNA
ncbi:hypothetical protein [Salimicrobium flavidum]|uniref:hypothetical protein n=1 Tax=Salimicrobium flavidum TaxID=570947 RepID=UPI001F2A5372|nr:hypothetical protein [Salimicrobium flavidum]